MPLLVKELSSALYEGDLVDQAGVAVPVGSITFAELTLYDVGTGTVINSRNHQNVLNTNGVTIDALGHLAWQMAPEDNAMVTTGKKRESHRGVFEFRWTAGASTRRHWHAADLLVENELKLPA